MARSQCFAFLDPKFVLMLGTMVAMLMLLLSLPLSRVADAQQSIPNNPQAGDPVAANTFANWLETGTAAANSL